jgi:superoxide dismutase
MSSSGFLWLVQEVDPLPSSTASSGGTDDLAVLATYGSGTMLVRAGELVHDRSKGFMSGLTEEGLVHLESRPWWMTGENDNQNKKNSEHGSSSEPNQPPLPFGNSSSLDPSPARAESSSSNLPSTDSSIARGYKRLVPLACLSMHEHAFMVDHGIWGKAEYVRAWMNNLDWELVEKRMAKEDFGGAVGGGSSAGTVRF